MLHEEGLENVFARHDRHAEATRRAAQAWGLEILCKEPRHYSSSLTALMMPAGHDADAFRKTALEHFDVSLGTGLSKVAGKVFRIGHLGDTNDLTIVGALAGVEMGLALAGVPHQQGRRAGRDGLFRRRGEPCARGGGVASSSPLPFAGEGGERRRREPGEGLRSPSPRRFAATLSPLRGARGKRAC